MANRRIVADTNVVISGLLWTGLPHEIIKLAERKKIILCTSLAIIEELSDVLGRDKFLSRLNVLHATRDELIEALLSISEVTHSVKTIEVVTEDPDDNEILACAISANADYVITGDPHLLKLKKYCEIPIINPRKFLAGCA